jgi:eukaryotic-like serine/threonine-protein kinase
VSRERFQRAVQRRATLAERDQVLLDALEPYIRRQPADFAEYEKRLRAAVRRYPLDAELVGLLAQMKSGFLDSEAQEIALFDDTLAIDPHYGMAFAYKAQAQAYWADFSGARATIDTCIASSASPTFCLHLRNNFDSYQGRCTRLEAGARQMIAIDPFAELGYRTLAIASYALDRPLETSRQALDQSHARMLADERAVTELEDRYGLGVLEGDFVAAERAAKDLEALVATSPSVAAHAKAAQRLADIYQEMGKDGAAAQAAEQYLKQREAWVPDPRGEDFAVLRDPTPRMLAALVRAGRITPDELDERRKAWVKTWTAVLMPRFRPFAWLHGYAAVAETPAEAARALEALPSFAPIPAYAPRTLIHADVGRTFFLGGRNDEALEYLKSAADSCLAIDHPIAHTRAQHWRGLALERAGETDRACASYATVLARWGRAKPRSVTAERARERSRALKCSG